MEFLSCRDSDCFKFWCFKVGQITPIAIFFYDDETFQQKKKLNCIMSKTSKITIGVSLASGALLAAWLLTGTRKEKTKSIISKGTASLKKSIKKAEHKYDDSEIHYI